MPRYIALDFGTCNTLIAKYHEARNEIDTQNYPGISRKFEYFLNGQSQEVYLVPSLIYYGKDETGKDRTFLGNQVIEQGKVQEKTVFKWMKRMIAERRRFKRHINGKRLDDFDAAKDLLRYMILFSRDIFDPEEDEIALTVPVDAYEDYQNFLGEVMESLNIRRYRLIDEATAAALGNDVKLRSSDPIMIFDFGGGTLDVAIVKIDLRENNDKKCRVLGKGAFEIGGSDIDQWLYRDVLKKNSLDSEDVKHISHLILDAVEDVKIRLSFTRDVETKESLFIFDERNAKTISADYSRQELESIMRKNSLLQRVQQTISEALVMAGTKGINMGDIRQVIMVGGSSLIPMVQEQLKINFGDIVTCTRPFDSVVRGACLFSSGKGVTENIILHKYAIKHFVRTEERGHYDYETLVPPGTDFPSNDDHKRRILVGLYDGQKEFKLCIYEIGKEMMKITGQCIGGDGEIIIKKDEETGNGHFQIGELKLSVDKPARRDEKTLSVDFMVDENKRLCVTAFDLRSREFLCKRRPVVTLV